METNVTSRDPSGGTGQPCGPGLRASESETAARREFRRRRSHRRTLDAANLEIEKLRSLFRRARDLARLDLEARGWVASAAGRRPLARHPPRLRRAVAALRALMRRAGDCGPRRPADGGRRLLGRAGPSSSKPGDGAGRPRAGNERPRSFLRKACSAEFLPEAAGRTRSADGTQRLQDGSDRHRRRGAGDAGVHGACLPVMRASTREEMRRISFTSRSSSRLFSIHSRYRPSSSSVSFKPTVFPRALRVQ